MSRIARALRISLLALAVGAGLLAGAAPALAQTPQRDLEAVLAHLTTVLSALDAGDAPRAAAALKLFREQWSDVELQVKGRSADAYARTEDDMATAAAELAANDLSAARATTLRMRARLEPFAVASARYGMFDAAVILFREGLEALLVVGALLAFLAKTGNAAKGRWVWGGAAAGIALSVGVAGVVNVIFSSGAAGGDREVIEGAVGLAAAALLVYMSWWLHSKSSLASWQKYVRDKATSALARNSLISLAAVSFLAVFREGAETVLFYAGMAPAISATDLVVGLAAGAVGLGLMGVAMLAFSLRLPIRLFFSVASVLIYYLAFKFIGTGVHALQVAGIAPATPVALPAIGPIGVFPTWETTVPQVVLLVAAAAVLLIPRVARAAPGPFPS